MRYTSSFPRWAVLFAALVAVCVVAPRPTAAQVAPGGVRGVVFDQLTGLPLEGARVRVDSQSRLTDAAGVFQFEEVASGAQMLSTDHYGYEANSLRISVEPDSTLVLEVQLAPAPVMIEGVEVVADRLALMERRFRSRRNAAAVSSRAFDAQSLTRSPAYNVSDFLRNSAGLRLVQCGGRREFPPCLIRRGQTTRPKVYFDEAPLAGGLEQLGAYSPDDLHLIEVYAEGLEIRAYSRAFMDQMARQPIVLFPVNIGR